MLALRSTTVPLRGAYTSETDLVDSTSPKGSPPVELGPHIRDVHVHHVAEGVLGEVRDPHPDQPVVLELRPFVLLGVLEPLGKLHVPLSSSVRT